MGPAQILDSMLTDGLNDAFSGQHSVHVFHTASDEDLTDACENLLHGTDNRLGARTTDPIYRQRRNGHWKTAANRSLARRVHAISSLNNIAHHHATNVRGLDA